MPYWYRRVLLLALPLILSNLTQPLLSTVDTILSGHLPGAAALGGVAMGGVFFNIIFWTFGFLRMGTGGLVAQAHGAKDGLLLRVHLLRGLLTALVVGVLILTLRAPLLALALHLLGAQGEVLHNAHLYCEIRLWAAPAALGNYVLLGYLLGRQRARLALVLQAFINVMNAGLALFFVLHQHWGVAGIGTATMLADWSGFLLGLALVCTVAAPEALTHATSTSTRGASSLAAILRHVVDPQELRRFFAMSSDIMVRTFALVLVFGWFTHYGATAGEVVLAANALLLNLHMTAAYAMDGFANAAEALVGEAVGARRRDEFRAVLRTTLVCVLMVGGAISLVYFTLGRFIIPLYTTSPAVQAAAMRYLPWAAALPVLSALAFQLDGVFIGATRTRELRNSMVLSFAGYCLLAATIGHSWGNDGLWCAMDLFNLLRGLTLWLNVGKIEGSIQTRTS